MTEEKTQDYYIKLFRQNPIILIEDLIGRKLSLFEKIVFNIQWKLKDSPKDILWCISKAWRKMK